MQNVIKKMQYSLALRARTSRNTKEHDRAPRSSREWEPARKLHMGRLIRSAG